MYKRLIALCFVGCGLLLFGLSGYLWLSNVYLSPERVLWRSMENNMRARSFSREVRQSEPGYELSQTSYIQFSPKPFVNGFVNIKQSGSEVETELYGTVENNFIRYSAIKPKGATKEQQDGLNAIANNWARQPAQEGSSFLQEFSYSTVPIGNLRASDRRDFLNELKTGGMYRIKAFQKIKDDRGRGVYEYTVDINLAKYVSFFQKFATKIGLGELSILQGAGGAADNTEVKIAVEPLSGRLVSIYSVDQDKTEYISMASQSRTFSVPTASLRVEDLQEKLLYLSSPATGAAPQN